MTDSVSSRREISLDWIRGLLGIPSSRSEGFASSLPFCAGDATAGSETELQAAVSGDRGHVDLPSTIENSNYLANVIRRAASGDVSSWTVSGIERYLKDNASGIWENSWFRLPMRRLSPLARETLESDLLSQKGNPASFPRSDIDRFLFKEGGEEFLRVPVSYLFKLALADVLGAQPNIPELISEVGTRAMDHLLSDNTSPETVSFHVVPIRPESKMGRGLAKETAKRFLLTQLLLMYANVKLSSGYSSQKAIAYFSPHPPVRQKQLNEYTSDSFYRDLFMSPCLSGWEDGEAKYRYMCLCHQVLSRSQLNAVAKLREAGIITRNLVVLPNLSNISLANNGAHISLGSDKVSKALEDRSSGFTATHEKYIGDLVIKIAEHFLPLFVGAYSADPYRLAFSDFHPELVLGFLPHELDYTHLRMFWRRWKKKAKLKILGQPVTPFGIERIDKALSAIFRLRGDYVTDFRLIDYLVAVMSTDSNPAMDGSLGSAARLSRDLADMGVFDEGMPLYLLYRMREHAARGFFGFEGRYYSLFASLARDLTHATNLQLLITALAFKYIFQGLVTHEKIPNSSFVESERRQAFFGAAIGLPTFYVRSDTGNEFLKGIVKRTQGVRYSKRYPGYIRVFNRQYRLALAETLKTDAADIIETLGIQDTMTDLMARLEDPRNNAVDGRLSSAILGKLGASSPLDVEATEFNAAAETYYREDLRKRHMEEALAFLQDDIQELEARIRAGDEDLRAAVHYTLRDRDAASFVQMTTAGTLDETLSLKDLYRLISLLLITIHVDMSAAEAARSEGKRDSHASPSIHSPGKWSGSERVASV